MHRIIQKESEFQTPKSKTPQKLFRDTALGKLISTTSCTDTQEVSVLLEEKKKQIIQIQNDFFRISRAENYITDEDRITKGKFYLMPSIRKTPVKSFYQNTSLIPKVKLIPEKQLYDEIEVF